MDWERDFATQIERNLKTFEPILKQLETDLQPLIAELETNLDTLGTQVEQTLDPLLSQVDQWLFEFSGQIEAEWNRPMVCQGCTYYHGRSYGETLLVCALHPTGPTNAHCRDHS